MPEAARFRAAFLHPKAKCRLLNAFFKEEMKNLKKGIAKLKNI